MPSATQGPTPRPSLGPHNWPGWLGVGLLWLLGKTPQGVAVALSTPLGALMRHTMSRRIRIAQRNVERCFPELDGAQRQTILRGCFRSLARAIFEITWAWSSSDRFMKSLCEVEGLEHVRNASQDGAGVLLVTAHITSLEIGARLMALALGPDMPASGIYRPLKSPVLEWYQNRCRTRYADSMISKRETRSAIRLLRRGGKVWYAPDQDFGRKQSVFTRLFGIQTATLLATHRLAQVASCAVVPMFPVYNEQTRRYTIRFLPALENFPSADPVADLERVNALMEAHIRTAPEQYWWIHRRFKTRPEGEPPFYD